jgi:hypothetical protein
MRTTIAASLTAVLLCGTALAADFTGTWKLNPDKSQVQHSDIVSETLKIEQTGPQTYRSIVDIVTKSGQKRHLDTIRVYDGQEHQLPGVDGAAGASEICSLTPPSTRKIIHKEKGAIVLTIDSSVSTDGKTMTNIRTDAGGKDVLVFDRQ